MRKPTRIEFATATASMLLVVSCAFAIIMAKIMVNLFLVMYGGVKHPWITEIFLAGSQWGFFVPLLPGIPAFLSWNRGRLEQDGPAILAVMHGTSVAVLMVVGVGIIMPLLFSNWGMTGQ
jgi:hypothetical protein